MQKLIIAAMVATGLTAAVPAGAANIVETAQGAGSFETLLAAAQAAGLADALATGQNLTVFAPTDEAFAALPEGTVEMLLKPENSWTFCGWVAPNTLKDPRAVMESVGHQRCLRVVHGREFAVDPNC